MLTQGCGTDDEEGAAAEFVQRAGSRLVKVQSVGLAAVGPMNPHSAVPSHAAAAFGEPASADRRGAVCVQRWPAIGLQIRFAAPAGEDPCGGEAGIDLIRIVGPAAAGAGWRTAEGVRPLQQLTAVRRIYPEARGVRSGRIVLVEPPGGGEPVLVVTIVNGRIGAMQFPIGPASG